MRVFLISFYSFMLLIVWDSNHPVIGKTSSQVETLSEVAINKYKNEKNFTFFKIGENAHAELFLQPQSEQEKKLINSTYFVPYEELEKSQKDFDVITLPEKPLNFPITEPTEPLNPKEVEEELGEIKIITPSAVKQPVQPNQPNVQLLLRSSVFTSSNITGVDFIERSDTVFVNSATLLATPKLSEETRLVFGVSGGLTSFATKVDYEYNYLNFNAAIQQRLAPGMYGQLGWVQDRLYDDGRILLDDSIRLTIGRQDSLASSLRLDSFYEFRGSFAEPKAQSRIANALGARLRYDFTPNLQGAFDYRLTFKNYTQQDRFDTQHQLGLDLVYNINQNFFVGSSASYLFGSSSKSSVDLDNFSVGINIGLNVPLF
jgi:Putative beta-barrel porin 2